MNLMKHLKRQVAFSRATFGPGARMAGVIDHIRKELVEVEKSGGDPEEWVDVVILAFDGLTRSLQAPYLTTDEVAWAACKLLIEKQNKNEGRVWPDWRTADPDKAIEHDRGAE